VVESTKLSEPNGTPRRDMHQIMAAIIDLPSPETVALRESQLRPAAPVASNSIFRQPDVLELLVRVVIGARMPESN
jgi:hypothetical protein